MQEIADPKVTFLDLVKTGWLSANVNDVTPKFGTGWYAIDQMRAQVTFTNLQERPMDGGATGYIGMDGGGAGGVQLVSGTVDVDVWAHRDSTHADGTAIGVNPKALTYAMMQEVRRIVMAAFGSVAGLQSLGFSGPSERPPDNTRSPTVFRYTGQIVYTWLRTPS